MDWITLGSATLRIIDNQFLQLWASSDYKYCATKDSGVSRLGLLNPKYWLRNIYCKYTVLNVLKTKKCVLLYFVDTNNFSVILCQRSLLNLLISVMDLKGHPILMLSRSQY